MAERLKYFVGGEWRTSETDEWYAITNSSTGEVMAEAPRCTAEEVDAAVAAAVEAYPAWRDTPLPERVQVMFRLKAKLDDNLHDLAVLLATEMGKTYNEARGDVLKAMDGLDDSNRTLTHIYDRNYASYRFLATHLNNTSDSFKEG